MTIEAVQGLKFSVSTSATVGAIAKALAAAQLAMGPAIKDRVGVIPGKDGKQGYQYGYATLAACFEAIQPLHANGIAVTQIPLDGGNGVLVATLLIHESGEWIRGELWMPVGQQSPQGYGSALSYARRYGLSALCGLASDDDDGEAASQGQPRGRQSTGPAKPPPPPPPVEPDPALFRKYCDDLDRAETRALVNGIASVAERARKAGKITDEQHNTLSRAVTAKLNVLGQQTANGGAA